MCFLWLFVLIAIVTQVSATEPDGHIQLRADWIPSIAAGGPPVVRLSIRSFIPLDEPTLTVSTPVEFVLRPVAPSIDAAFQNVPAAQARRAIRTGLQRLDSAGASTLDFELSLSPGGYGILEFIVEGRDSTGRTIRNAIGFAAGESPPTGVHRLGAIEFPAAILAPTEKK